MIKCLQHILHIVEADTHSIAAISRRVGGSNLSIMAITFIKMFPKVTSLQIFSSAVFWLTGGLREKIFIALLMLLISPTETVYLTPKCSF